jgi:hypothetical protein
VPPVCAFFFGVVAMPLILQLFEYNFNQFLFLAICCQNAIAKKVLQYGLYLF